MALRTLLQLVNSLLTAYVLLLKFFVYHGSKIIDYQLGFFMIELVFAFVT